MEYVEFLFTHLFFAVLQEEAGVKYELLYPIVKKYCDALRTRHDKFYGVSRAEAYYIVYDYILEHKEEIIKDIQSNWV